MNYKVLCYWPERLNCIVPEPGALRSAAAGFNETKNGVNFKANSMYLVCCMERPIVHNEAF